MFLKLPCWICGDTKTQSSQHHIIPRSMGGGDADWNLINLDRLCHDAVHQIPHPDTLFDKVNRVQPGSSRHKRIKKVVSRLEKEETRERLLQLREVIHLVNSGVPHKEALERAIYGWITEEKWKSQSPLKDLSL